MWLILENDLSKEFVVDKHTSYLLEVNKINFLAGQNNGGKSYFLRRILNDTLTIIKSKENLHELIIAIFDIEKEYSQIEVDDIRKLDIQNLLPILNEYDNLNKQLDLLKNNAHKTGSQYGMGYSSGLNGKESNNYPGIQMENIQELLATFDIKIETVNKIGQAFDEIYYQYDNYKIKIKQKLLREFIEEIVNFDEKDIYKLGSIINNMGLVDRNQALGVLQKNQFKYYIPIFRSIRHPLKTIDEKVNIEELQDVYRNRIVSEYKISEDYIKVFTGLDLYYDFKKRLLGNKSERKKVIEFENFISQNFFNGKSISLVPDEETFELKIDIEDEHDLFIYQVGDGISSLIIMLYYCFMEQDTQGLKLICIEEPENSFHAGYQRLFANIISYYKKFENFIFIMTTHSNHLIDIGVNEYKNATLYLTRKIDNKINITKTDDRLLVNENLEVKPTSVCISDKIIWIEGKYDALYIRILLTLKNINSNKKIGIEDYDYCYVPYSGSNITNIDFVNANENETKEFIAKAKSINFNFVLILDDDDMESSKTSEKYKRYLELKKTLKERIYKLKVREIENLFPVEVVSIFIRKGLRKFKYNHENYTPEDATNLLDIKYDEYKNQKLGNYINKKLEEKFPNTSLKTITNREYGFSTKEGIKGFLYNKDLFHEAVTEWFNNDNPKFEDLPEETKDLVNYVESFIKTGTK